MHDVMRFTPRRAAVAAWMAAMPIAYDQRGPQRRAYRTRRRAVVQDRGAAGHDDAVQYGVTRQAQRGTGRDGSAVSEAPRAVVGQFVEADDDGDLGPLPRTGGGLVEVRQEPPADVD